MQKRTNTFAEEMGHLASRLERGSFRALDQGLGLAHVRPRGELDLGRGSVPVDHSLELPEDVRQKLYREMERGTRADIAGTSPFTKTLPNEGGPVQESARSYTPASMNKEPSLSERSRQRSDLVVSNSQSGQSRQSSPISWNDSLRELDQAVRGGAFGERSKVAPTAAAYASSASQPVLAPRSRTSAMRFAAHALDTLIVSLSTFAAWVTASRLALQRSDELHLGIGFAEILSQSANHPMKALFGAFLCMVIVVASYWGVFRLGVGMTLGQVFFGQSRGADLGFSQKRTGS